MGVIYGYARCSTSELRQDIDRQKRDLLKLGVEDDAHIYWEYESGAKTNRPELTKLLNIVQPGDTIISTEVSRLSRSTQHLCEILSLIQNKKLRLIIGTFCVDCRADDIDAMTKGMLMMWAVFAEMERDIISEHVRSGMKNAVAKGKKIGRPQTTADDIPANFWKAYNRYKNNQLTVTEMSRILECSRGTVYKYIRIANEQ